jgi:acyl phosphate:glycerol-3-phosphate acyltransferase
VGRPCGIKLTASLFFTNQDIMNASFALWMPVLTVIAAYLLGSIAFAILVSRAMGLSDPRTFGSRNPGATNVLRSGKRSAAIATLVLDALKGYAPVVLMLQMASAWGVAGTASEWAALAGLAAFLGHLYPVFFRFKGGKGVATAVGVLFGLEPTLGLACLGTFLILVYFSRFVSLASVVAAVFAPFYWLFGHGVAWQAGAASTACLTVMSLMLIWRHRENLQRIMKGTESKL